MFTGNPGVGLFYTEFLEQLHEKLGMPVWVVSHAGHEFPEQDRLVPSLNKNEHLFDVDGQIKNKQEFINRFVPRGCKLHLVGHSVGAYMSLQLLKDDGLANQVQACYLLFPVLENIATTPNGRFFNMVAVKFLWLIYFLAGVFSLFPNFLKLAVLSIYFRVYGTGTSLTVKRAVMLLINPKALRAVFFLAIDEMNCIKDLDRELILKRKDKLVVYYGDHDRWAPVSHYERLIKAVPGVNAQVCQNNLDHAFMLVKPAHLMAEVMEHLINSKRLS